MTPSIKILNKEIGGSNPCFIIGEIGLNHNGSVEIAKKIIDSAVAAGCDAVKMQKRDVANLATKEVLDAKDERFPEFGKTYREIRNFLEFNKEQYLELMDYAKKKKIAFLCTAFDSNSAKFLLDIKIDAFKIASHSLTNLPFIEYIAKTKIPTILSTGMARLDQVDKSVEFFKKNDCPLILLHCVSEYPTPPESANLRMIQTYQKRYDVPIGFSGHEIGYLPTPGAVFMGAKVIERHITLDTKMPGFDHKLSLDPQQLKNMVNDIRTAEKCLGTGQKKISEKEMITANKYHVSAVSKIEIKAGEKLTSDMIEYKNPGTGISPDEVNKILGKTASADIESDTLLSLKLFY